MPILAIILTALKSFGAGLWQFTKSPIGLPALALAFGVWFGGHRADIRYEQREAARIERQRVADDAEKERQHAAAVVIEAHDRARETTIAAAASERESLIRQIEAAPDVKTKIVRLPGKTVAGPCDLHDGLTDGLRRLDASPKRRRAP